MRVLLVSGFYAPEEVGIGPYSAELAHGLAAMGHHVEVVTLPAHFPGWRVDRSHRVRSLRRTSDESGVLVHRLAAYVPSKPTPARRVAHEAAFAVGLAGSRPVLHRPDAVIVVSPPLTAALAALAMARSWRVPAILHLQDLVPGIAEAAGAVRNHLVLGLAAAAERYAYRCAAAVSVVSPGYRDHVGRLGHAGKCVVIPNWVREVDLERPPRDLTVRARLGVGAGQLAAVYSGSVGRKQGIEVLGKAASLPEASGIRFVAVCEGPGRAEVEACRSERPGGLTLLPLQPRRELARLLAACDVGLVVQRRGVRDAAMPSKLLTYAAAGLPVVVAADPQSEAARWVERVRCGFVAPPEQPRALVDRLDWLRAHRDAAGGMAARGRAYVTGELRAERLLRRWDALLGQVTSRSRAPGTAGVTWRHSA